MVSNVGTEDQSLNLHTLPLFATLLVILGYFAMSLRPVLIPVRAHRSHRNK